MKTRYIYKSTVTSTNGFASDLLSKSNPSEILCIYTHNQTEGKGQIGRKWHAETGKNLTFSVVLSPSKFPVELQFVLNKKIALVIRKFVETKIHRPTTIKWPNDIYVDNKKIAGILVQNILQGKKIKHCIVGVGMNINQKTFPKNIPNPTSFALEGYTGVNKLLSLLFELVSLIAEIDVASLEMERTKTAEDYNEHLFGNGKTRKFICNQETLVGKVLEVNDKGQLCLQDKKQIKAYNFGEIRWVIDDKEKI